MRDLATYEVDLCDNIGIRAQLKDLSALIEKSRRKLNSLNIQNDILLQRYLSKVDTDVAVI
jgi:hypothetical protein